MAGTRDHMYTGRSHFLCIATCNASENSPSSSLKCTVYSFFSSCFVCLLLCPVPLPQHPQYHCFSALTDSLVLLGTGRPFIFKVTAVSHNECTAHITDVWLGWQWDVRPELSFVSPQSFLSFLSSKWIFFFFSPWHKTGTLHNSSAFVSQNIE